VVDTLQGFSCELYDGEEYIRTMSLHAEHHIQDTSVVGDDCLLGLYIPPKQLDEIDNHLPGGRLALAHAVAELAVGDCGALLSLDDTGISRNWGHFNECITRFPSSYADFEHVSQFVGGYNSCFLDFPSPKYLTDLVCGEGDEDRSFEDHRKARCLALATQIRQVANRSTPPIR